jgi:hypothetical protein
MYKGFQGKVDLSNKKSEAICAKVLTSFFGCAKMGAAKAYLKKP